MTRRMGTESSSGRLGLAIRVTTSWMKGMAMVRCTLWMEPLTRETGRKACNVGEA